MGMLLHRFGGSAGIHVCVRDGDKGRFEVGWAPTFSGVVLADVFVDLVFEVVFAVFGIRLHAVHVCWPSTDRWWVLTVLGGVSGPLSRHSQPWVMLTDLGNVVAAFR